MATRVGINAEPSRVTTYDRYEVLQQDDGIVLRHSDSALSNPICDHDCRDRDKLENKSQS